MVHDAFKPPLPRLHARAHGGALPMRLLLIADKDVQTRQQMAELFGETEYQVVTPDSVDAVLADVLKRDVGVILLGSEFDDVPAGDLIPILKKCKRDLTIILVANEQSLPLLRKFRREGIFYHALRPNAPEDREELLQAVQCAFQRLPPATPAITAFKK